MLVHTLATLNDLMLSSVFASVNNLYHREPQKRVIDRQHARLYNAVTGKLPEQARGRRASTSRACARTSGRSNRKSNGWCARRCGSTDGDRGSLALGVCGGVQMAPYHADRIRTRARLIAFVIRRATDYAENLADGPRLRCQRESRLS